MLVSFDGIVLANSFGVKSIIVGGSPGLVVMGRDSRFEGRGFKSQHRILDGHFSHIFAAKIVVMFV